MIIFDVRLRKTDDRKELMREQVVKTLYNDKNFQTFGNKPGLYMMYNIFGEILYIGQTKCFLNRFADHHKFHDRGLMAELNKIRIFALEGEIKEQRELDDLEKALICKEQPRFNDIAKGCFEIHYVARYANAMLKLADYELEEPKERWTGLRGIHGLHLQYIELTWDIKDLYTNWWSIGVPNMRRLKHLVYEGMTIKELSKIYGVPEDHIRRKVYYEKYEEVLKKYYKGKIVMEGWK